MILFIITALKTSNPTFKHSVLTSQETYYVTITREEIPVGHAEDGINRSRNRPLA
jgi:hypothetical protein